MSSSQLDDINDKTLYYKLAKILGISYTETVELDPEIQDHTSNDGVLYGFCIKFSKDSPKYLIDKINGIDKSGTLYINANAFDKPDDD